MSFVCLYYSFDSALAELACEDCAHSARELMHGFQPNQIAAGDAFEPCQLPGKAWVPGVCEDAPEPLR